MAVERVDRAGKPYQVPYGSRPENQAVTVTRKAWGELHERIRSLEQAVKELTESLEGGPPIQCSD